MHSTGNESRTNRSQLYSRVRYYLPGLKWIADYETHNLRDDIIAGVSVACLIIPQGLAFAALVQVPPVYGLYTASVPLIIYALFGMSR